MEQHFNSHFDPPYHCDEECNRIECNCEFIAEVREDMRQPGRITVLIDEAYQRGQRDGIAKCIAAVEAISDGGSYDIRYILGQVEGLLYDLQESAEVE
jgi:hypothetical protein